MWVLRISSKVPPHPKPDTNSWSFWPCKLFVWTSVGSALRETTHGFLALRECVSWPRPSWECPLWPDIHRAKAQSYTLLRLTVSRSKTFQMHMWKHSKWVLRISSKVPPHVVGCNQNRHFRNGKTETLVWARGACVLVTHVSPCLVGRTRVPWPRPVCLTQIMPYQTQKWSSPQVSRIGPLFRKFGSILYGKGPSQEPQNKCSGGFAIYEHKQKTSTKLNSIKSSYQPMIWWIVWNIWHRVRVSWSRSVPPWTFAINFLHCAHGATTIQRQNCNDPTGRLRVPWPRPNRHKEPATWAGQMGPGVSLDVRLTHTRTSLMDSTGAQTGPITSHHQLGDGRRTKDLWKKSGHTPHPRNRNLTKKIQSGTLWSPTGLQIARDTSGDESPTNIYSGWRTLWKRKVSVNIFPIPIWAK